ncbi:hypothetical protein JOC34_000601 [Virgibacillus halotolerans]|uniref:hypothetical protein n=1 Tax=Virgibacillus halotolerans TaxID=1071053 RepID=UPI001961AE97|nr:hypothetical protein [Virgibacillus halotolerans]MBM7598244.1 hypothetical protein [Virgibacillus halotolerans]
MSMQQGARTVDELLDVIKPLAKEMIEFNDCGNVVREIEIYVDRDGDFVITSD